MGGVGGGLLINFDALRNLHDSVNDLLQYSFPGINSNTTVVHVHQISEASLKMVEACGNTRDVLLLVKDHLHSLQSTFRRVTAVSAAAAAAGYSVERKKLKKAMLRRLNSLKTMNNNKYWIINSNNNQNLTIVIKVLGEVRIATVAILESLMSLMSMSMPMPMPTPNCSRRGQKQIQKSNNKGGFFEYSRLSRVDSLSRYWEKCDRTALQAATKRLAAVKVDVEDLEQELDCIYRRLIQTRVSLLNILTAH